MEKTIIQEIKRNDLNLEKEISFLLSEKVIKKEREREIVKNRHGLFGANNKTLEEIGHNLKITRERVRQIEKSALKKIAQKSSELDSLNSFYNKVENYLNSVGGVANEERIISKFIKTKEQDRREVNIFLFALGLDKNLHKHNENKEFRNLWHSQKIKGNKISLLSASIDKILAAKKKTLTETELAGELKEDINEVESILWLKKNVLQTDEKKWGLSTWREVNPKSIRDKTYLILKKHTKPLHYEEITKKISEHRLQKRPVTKQAVHNELIRDPRFILIGRGIYALREWGYEPGVVEEVIRDILAKSETPLHKNEIIRLVKQKRIVKETTIILNLQKKTFKRVARATYTLSE